MGKSHPGFNERGDHRTPDDPSQTFPPRLAAPCMAVLRRACSHWRDKHPLLIRATAHLSVVFLALIALALRNFSVPAPRAIVGDSFGGNAVSSVALDTSQPKAMPSPTPSTLTSERSPSEADTITRLPVPHTTFPNRPRSEVITYTVKQGDSIFTIATQFNLSPATVVWSNREALKDAPWLIQPGITLFILPVDGVYHTVRAGETLDGIAAEYEVDSAALYNQWNDLEEDQEVKEGQLLVVPGGKGEEVAWKPPEPGYATTGTSQYSYGVCSGISFTGPGANGWFTLPTGRRRVSGWYFHDPRNPTHIGLDYTCQLGDPIYAADNGVVTIAGWNGGYGVLARISHGNGFTTRYAHLSELAVGCGQAVRQGDIIGYCGSTGWSTGAHLHFEIRKNGVPQDPQAYQP